jgi:hypothetical protein
VRPDVPGFVLDATALVAAPRSIFARTLIRMYVRNERPIVVPATALVVACATGAVTPEEFDPAEFTVTALTQSIVPAVALIIASASAPTPVEVAHAAYEAAATGYPVVTTRPQAYRALTTHIDVEQLPD